MLAYKLEKDITLFRQQYEDFMMEIYGSYILDRLSIDLDSIAFRMNYMKKHNIDLDKLQALEDEFNQKALQFRDHLSYLILNLIERDFGFTDKFVEELLISDTKLDQNYIKFKMILVSPNEEYINKINDYINEDNPYNIYPDKYFRFFTDSYNDGMAKAYPELFEDKEQNVIGTGADKDIFIHNITFQTSETCSLSCTYCYQFAKSECRMNFDTAKKFIDNLLNDKYGYVNRYNSPAVILEFIGGEPFLEIHLTRKIYEYFLDQAYKLNHPWFTMHRLSICSNGLQYFNKEVQSFFKDYSSQISFNISIDGNKELHDSCRVQPNGEGSYDIDMMALNHFNKYYTKERNSKMTLAPSNISYLYDSVVDFIKNGMSVININCVFEEGWQPKHASIEYQELKKLANYILNNDLEHLYIAIFNDKQEGMSPRENDGSFCGGSGSMLAIRPNGEFYPCLRYMPSSVGTNRDSMVMGDVEHGMDSREKGSEVIRRLDRITRRSQNNDICYECPLSSDCASCLALGHTVFNNPNKRTTFTCIMVIAEALANVYYWNAMITKHPEWNIPVRKNVVPDEWALLVIDREELDFLKKLEKYASMISE